MIQLLFTLIFVEMGLIMILLFKTPLRKLSIMGLDRVKRGRGPLMVKTVAGTVFLVLISSLYSMKKIQERSVDAGAVNPTDQVLMGKHLLEASLMGFSLFLALMIDRLHHYIRELRLLRKSMEAVKKQSRGFEDGKMGGSEGVKASEEEITGLKTKVKHLETKYEGKVKEVKAVEANAVALRKQSEGVKALEEEMIGLKTKVKHLETEYEGKVKELKAAEANAVALRKQSEGFLFEYDRLLEDNQNIRNQLQSIDHMLSYSSSKKKS
ncbi:B-cell receptor-associated 31-like [Macleaya cordata]|uniref:Endoplasmic reticulum transmembrane protein n=1 Tax=Macleaya cordata TaxID=56857 RepID=A0A200PYT2_MACCD|nr:B-cell receptor-associated 31-like [Macleaya cordata]